MFNLSFDEFNPNDFKNKIELSYVLEKVFKKYNIKREEICYDLDDGEKVFFNQKELKGNVAGRITKPDDFRGYWKCSRVRIANYSPLIFEVDGVDVIPY